MPGRIILRATWSATGRNGFGKRPLPARAVRLHHTVTPVPVGGASATLAQDIDAVKIVERVGEERFGSISYNYTIPPSGRIFEGVSVDRIGAHTAGRNTTEIGVSLIGNYETSPMTPAQRASLVWLLKYLRSAKAVIAPAPLVAHRDIAATACPGKNAYAQIAGIEKESRMTTPTATPAPAPKPAPAPAKPVTRGIYLIHLPKRNAMLLATEAVEAGHPAWVTSAGRDHSDMATNHTVALRQIIEGSNVPEAFPGKETHAVLAVWADFTWAATHLGSAAKKHNWARAREATGNKTNGYAHHTNALADLLEQGVDIVAVFGRA